MAPALKTRFTSSHGESRMLIEGGYLHSLKALLEKAEDTDPPKPRQRANAKDRDSPEGFASSLRALGAKLLRRSDL